MSYYSGNVLARSARLDDVRELVELLSYRRIRTEFKIAASQGEYSWFETRDYKSYSGVELGISSNDDGAIVVETRSTSSRSHWDLLQQNRTIRMLRRLFGGTFKTDVGRSRYFPSEGKPPSPAAAGCHLAFQRFGGGLIRASYLLESRHFSEQWKKRTGLEVIDSMNPRLLSNNLLIPYLVAILEEYFKSTFVAILRYSDRRRAIFHNARLTADNLVDISSANTSVEEAFAETLSFQRISKICQHFKTLDPDLDLVGTLRKPFRRRRESLFDSLEAMTEQRHALIHNASSNPSFDDKDAHRALDDLEQAVVRCYRRLTSVHGWEFDQGWVRGNRRDRTGLTAQQGDVADDAQHVPTHQVGGR